MKTYAYENLPENTNERSKAKAMDTGTQEGTMPSTFWSRNWQKFVAVTIWLIIVGSFVTYGVVTGKSATGILKDLVGLMQTPYGALLYIIIYAVRPLAFFSAAILTLAAGSIFGPVWGVLLTIVGSNTSASVAYLLAFFLGKGVLDESETKGTIANYANRMRRNSFETILIMRFIFLPYDLVNYLAGFLRIKYAPFILATILGSIPGTITFVLAGASVQINDVFSDNFQPSFNPWTLAGAAVLFVISIGFSRWMKQREARRMNNPEQTPVKEEHIEANAS
jgi:uncharacterized membrane protein YdjX (TVP38/TMEM64 family)